MKKIVAIVSILACLAPFSVARADDKSSELTVLNRLIGSCEEQLTVTTFGGPPSHSTSLTKVTWFLGNKFVRSKGMKSTGHGRRVTCVQQPGRCPAVIACSEAPPPSTLPLNFRRKYVTLVVIHKADKEDLGAPSEVGRFGARSREIGQPYPEPTVDPASADSDACPDPRGG